MRNERWRLLTMMMAGLMSLAINAQELKDSVGAQDFTCETVDGRRMKLSELPAGRETLLLFYDPDCSDCRQELFAMRHSTALRRAVNDGRLQVLAVCVGDDERLWRQSCEELPPAWTLAIAREDLSQHPCYDTSSLPMLYLLDNKKQVLRSGGLLSEILQ